MMTSMALPVVVLLLIMPIGLLGIVLFIVGLVKKKPAMWGSGIAIAVLGLMVFAMGAGALMWLGARRASVQRLSAAQAQMVAQIQARAGVAQGDLFKNQTGLDLPPGTQVVTRGAGNFGADQDYSTQYVMLNLAVQPDFYAFLADNFTKANWQDVAPTFQIGRSRIPGFLPGDNRLQNMALHVLTKHPDANSPSTVTAVVAHDAGAHQAWVVSVQEKTPATQPYWKPDQ